MRTASIAGFFVGFLAIGCLAGCGSDGPMHIELSGKTPAEGSALAATAVCGQVARCGSLAITCVGTSEGVTGCSAMIAPVTHAGCYAIVQPDLEETLSCPELTPALVDMLELCLDATAREPCLTQAQADALAAQASANGGIVDTDPPECAFLKDPNVAPGC
jgi:hypothetical protein